MQSADALLSIYQTRGSKGLPLERVYRQLFNPELYLQAYGKIYRNCGAMTRGSTTETVDGMSLQKIHGIIGLLNRSDTSGHRFAGRKSRRRTGRCDRWASRLGAISSC